MTDVFGRVRGSQTANIANERVVGSLERRVHEKLPAVADVKRGIRHGCWLSDENGGIRKAGAAPKPLRPQYVASLSERDVVGDHVAIRNGDVSGEFNGLANLRR